MINRSIANRAAEWASAAHSSIGHVRKYTGEPYFVHLAAVAALVAERTDDAEVIAAAYLHDVLEDVAPLNPAFALDRLAAEFGERIASIVVELTDVYTKAAYPALNRKARKRLEAERLGRTSPEAKLIKLADLEDNGKDILANSPGFSRVYLVEKAELEGFLNGTPITD